jgi:hypothetical protein
VLESHPLLANLLPAPVAAILPAIDLIAQMDLSEVSTHFKGGPNRSTLSPVIILTALPILAGAGIAALYHYSHPKTGSYQAPERLFQDLCKAHQLTRHEVRLMKEMAESLDSLEPSLLFLLVNRFDQAASRIGASGSKNKTTAAIESIRGRLFGFPIEKKPAG